MASRLAPRLSIVSGAVVRRFAGGRRVRPAHPRRILIAHHLLLGDTLMLTPLLAKARAQHPDADIAMTMMRAATPLYSGRPYGVRALGWDPRDRASVKRLLAEPPFDLALVPGDNRYAWLAAAMGARWIVAFGGDRPAYKSWPVDELRDYPAVPRSWFDTTASLIDGPPPAPFGPGDWPAPDATPFSRPDSDYCVLHIGASSPLKLWNAERWHALARDLRANGYRIAWSGGRGETELVNACAPDPADLVTAGKLDLAQLWHLLRGAKLLVAPDTGVAHLGRIAGTPTLALFGPSSAILTGHGEFWRNSRFRPRTIDPFACRDQRVLFKREIDWVRVCRRAFGECTSPACMHALEVSDIAAAARELAAGIDAIYPVKRGHSRPIPPV
jgi:ADP-heptose:LPS heptosyltransferase